MSGQNARLNTISKMYNRSDALRYELTNKDKSYIKDCVNGGYGAHIAVRNLSDIQEKIVYQYYYDYCTEVGIKLTDKESDNQYN